MGAAALVGGTVMAAGVGAYASNKSAKAQSSAAQAAADASTAASVYSADMQKEMYDLSRKDMWDMYNTARDDSAPYREAGKNALGQITDNSNGLNSFFLKGYDAPEFNFDTSVDPSYNFRFNEGLKATQNAYASKGGFLSGSALKGITDYGQQSASQEYNNAFNRYLNQNQQDYNIYTSNQNNAFNKLATMAGLGQTSTNQLNNTGSSAANNSANLGSNYANSLSNIAMNNAANSGNALMAKANANGSAYSGYGNAMNSLFGNLSSFYNSYNNNYNYNGSGISQSDYNRIMGL
jgi:hypothetical protein